MRKILGKGCKKQHWKKPCKLKRIYIPIPNAFRQWRKFVFCIIYILLFPSYPAQIIYLFLYFTWYHASFKIIFSLFTLTINDTSVCNLIFAYFTFAYNFSIFPQALYLVIFAIYLVTRSNSMSPCLPGESHGKCVPWGVLMLGRIRSSHIHCFLPVQWVELKTKLTSPWILNTFLNNCGCCFTTWPAYFLQAAVGVGIVPCPHVCVLGHTNWVNKFCIILSFVEETWVSTTQWNSICLPPARCSKPEEVRLPPADVGKSGCPRSYRWFLICVVSELLT